MPSIQEAKARLDSIIAKARTDMYKPIQIAEVLYQSRIQNVDISDMENFRNSSKQWRNTVTKRLLGKFSTSSADYQDAIWSAMPIDSLMVLDLENKRTCGGVERYIYLRFRERQEKVGEIISLLDEAKPENFRVEQILNQFRTEIAIKRTIDKAYEIVSYSLFQTIVAALEAKIKIVIPESELLTEFSDLAKLLLGFESDTREIPAHIYRVGVTNAADRGLDMWANFGIAIQVKHLTLDPSIAQSIVDQVESDRILIVCRDCDAEVITTVVRQISWGRRICGIIRESELIIWYDRCLRGRFAYQLSQNLIATLSDGFKTEFPQAQEINTFLNERNYLSTTPDRQWMTSIDQPT